MNLKKLTIEQLRKLRGQVNQELGLRAYTKADKVNRGRCSARGITWKECKAMSAKERKDLGIIFEKNII